MKITSYRSGASNVSDLKGYTLSGVPIGLPCVRVSGETLAYLSPNIENEAILYTLTGHEVFIDSGAFSVFQHNLKTGSNLSLDFDKIMEKYRYYAFFGQFSMVMPDIIGDQGKTLSLQDHYKNDIKDLIDMGSDVIIPIQKGPLSPAECWDAVIGILGTTNVRIAIPSNKEAFSLMDCTNLLSHPTPPRKIHLLGLTHANPRFQERIAKILEYAPGTSISCDGNRLRAMLGENRRITKSQRDLQQDFQQIIYENSKRDDNEDTDIWGVITTSLAQQLTEGQVREVGDALACDESEIEEMIVAGCQCDLQSWIEENLPGFGIYPENDLFEVVLSWESKEQIGYSVKHEGFRNELNQLFPNGFIFCQVPEGVARVAAVATHADEYIPHVHTQKNIFACLPN